MENCEPKQYQRFNSKNVYQGCLVGALRKLETLDFTGNRISKLGSDLLPALNTPMLTVNKKKVTVRETVLTM